MDELYVRPDYTHARWRSAFRRALARAGEYAPVIEAVQPDWDGSIAVVWLRVPSASHSDHAYRVAYRPHTGAVCDCDAGVNGDPCWHVAAVWLWMSRDTRLVDPIRVRIALGQFADPVQVARERARLSAALAGVVV